MKQPKGGKVRPVALIEEERFVVHEDDADFVFALAQNHRRLFGNEVVEHVVEVRVLIGDLRPDPALDARFELLRAVDAVFAEHDGAR